MEIAWLSFAFVCGLAVKLLSLPPLIGFLIAGFALNLAGVQTNDTLNTLADLGITLMLFTIGLKLNVRDLLKREVFVSTLSHLGLWMVVLVTLLMMVSSAGLGIAAGLSVKTAALLAFALGFSSTVCVIKVLEDSGELKTRHGRLAVAILVMQDVIAVAFLSMATDKTPSPLAFGLLGLILLRPVLRFLLNKVGHGEMLPLMGLALALGGYELFSAVGMKGDLGALVAGLLLSGHGKAGELSKSLLSFKDLFLIGFFLTIGLTALPDSEMVVTAIALSLVLSIKMVLFFGVMAAVGLRARTAFLAALVLSDYSEFGLILIVLYVTEGWLSPEWLIICALAVAMSFVFTSAAYRLAHGFYARHRTAIRRFEKSVRLPEDQVYRPTEAEILVVGIGRVGRGAFEALHKVAGNRVWGMDASRDLIDRERQQGKRVFVGDAENADIWEMIDVKSIRLVLLAVASVDDNRNIAKQLRIAGYTGPIAAIARYDDEGPRLRDAGIDKVFNFFTQAGAGFAEESLNLMGEDRDTGAQAAPSVG